MAQSPLPSHDTVMDIDTELQLLLNDVPRFFTMSVGDLVSAYQLEPAKAASIAYQGHMFGTLFYSQRCIIHIPYYTLGFTDPKYAPSREICLQSARLIIQTEVGFKKSRLHALTRFNFLGLFVAVFMASIVFFMESCYNKNLPNRESSRRDLEDAIKILEESRHESETASKFLSSLMKVVRKHLILSGQATERASTSTSASWLLPVSNKQDIYTSRVSQCRNIEALDTLPRNSSHNMECDIHGFGDKKESEDDLSTYFTELAGNFEKGVDFAGFDWDNIFSGLDSSSQGPGPDLMFPMTA